MSDIKLEVGKTYRQRNGNIFKVTERHRDGIVVVEYNDNDLRGSSFRQDNGKSVLDTAYDAVEEVTTGITRQCEYRNSCCEDEHEQHHEPDCLCDSRHLATIGHEDGCKWLEWKRKQ